jgi:N-acylneuraminate cytidylyltransferase
MSAVAIIPARGGSKRIPFKNGRDFCGRPMLAWPIAAAPGCGVFDRTVVSTEDIDLAEGLFRLAGLADRPR